MSLRLCCNNLSLSIKTTNPVSFFLSFFFVSAFIARTLHLHGFVRVRAPAVLSRVLAMKGLKKTLVGARFLFIGCTRL